MLQFQKNGVISFIRGDDIRIPMTLSSGGVPTNLTGYSFRAQIRTKPNGYVVLDFDVDTSDLATGTIVLGADHSVTELIRATEGFWDLEMTYPDGTVNTIIGPAKVTIIKDVSLP